MSRGGITGCSGLRALERAWAFGRPMPLRKILRRLQLTLTRAVRDRWGWPAVPAALPAPALDPAAPAPLFPPRAACLVVRPDHLAFTFLGHTHLMVGAIDWRAPGPGPAWQLWRMNLHYMDYLEGVDDAQFLAIVADWIAANPPGRPGAWKDSWNAYAVSIRVVIWMGEIARRRLTADAQDLKPILQSLAAQLGFLEGALETDLEGNHLIKNVKALLWASAFFAGADARRWRRLGGQLLGQALRRQILADGVHYERSPSYHGQVFADLLDCRHALAASREAPCPALDAALSAMAAAVADLAHPDGDVAQFNDAGLHMAYAPAASLDVFAKLFDHRPRPRRSFAFPAAGYFGLRAGGDYLVVDCGRIAPDDLPAHGHGDILSFEWSVAGVRIVVDQGVFDYGAGPRRTGARSAASHNTLCFEDADQADFYGAFRCGRRPKVSLLRLDQDDQRLVLEGTHDGFRHLPGGPRHIRRIQAAAGRLDIVDRIEGRPDRAAHVGFLLHPEVAVAAVPGGLRLARGSAAIVMRSSAAVAIRDAVHWPDMGVERPTKRLWIAIDRGTCEVITTFETEAADPRRSREMS